MSYKKQFIFVLVLTLVCGFLFYSVYRGVEKTTISHINSHQMTLAKQAEKSIQSFFNHYINNLTCLSKENSIIDMDTRGKKTMRIFYQTNSKEIKAITRVSAKGEIVYTVPYDKQMIETDIFFQSHVSEAMRTRQTTVSDMFIAVQGHLTVAIHVPIFKDSVYMGSIAVLVPFDTLTRAYLENIKVLESGYAWMISQTGTILYSPIAGHADRSVFQAYTGHPEAIDTAIEAMKAKQGTATYTGNKLSGKPAKDVRYHAVYLPVNIGNTFWSIIVATPEDEVLATMKGLRNKFILIAGILMFAGIIFSYFLVKAWAVLDEEEKRKQAEAALRESENKFRDLAEKSNVGIYLMQDDSFKYINLKFAQIHGYSIEELMQKKPIDLVYPGDWPISEPNMHKKIVDGTSSPHFSFRIVTKNNETKHVEDYSSRTMYQGKPAVIGTLLDVTEHKHLETQLRQSQKLEAIGQLAGGIAHDFNNIITALIGYGNLLKMKLQKDDPVRIYADRIITTSEKAAGLTHSLLAFSRKQAIELKPHKIDTIMTGIERLLKRLLTEDIELIITLSDPNLTIMADYTQIEQVLLNLVTNARDAMPRGGRLRIETSAIKLDREFIRTHGYGRAGKHALISVSDTGIGMDEKTKERIFEPFFTTKEMGKGTGLGLSTVYGIVKQHNGYINVYSELNRGTTFHIYLPVVKGKAEEKETPPAPDIKGGTETILLAEDNPDVRGLAKEILKNAGYTVIEAENGEEAIQRFSDHKYTIQLLILDVVMPRKNGKEAYEEIRKMAPDIRALFTSGYTGDVVFDKGIHGDGFDFIPKPLSPNELLLKVRKILDKETRLSHQEP